MNGLFTDNPYFNEYETRLRQLHRLIAEGKGNTEEADEVRDAMDTPWLHLTEAEVARLDGLSADLYMLQNREVFEPSDGRSKIQIGQAIYAAVKQEKWKEALVLMRKPNSIPRAKVATYRVAAYEALGQTDAALMFLRYLITLDPSHPVLKAVELSLLKRTHRLEEAEQKATAYLNDATQSPFLRINSAGLLALNFEYLPHSDYSDFVSIYDQIVAMLISALNEEQPTTLLRKETIEYGYEILGYCYFKLGKLHEALEAAKDALRFGPSEASTLMLQSIPKIAANLPGEISNLSAFSEYERVATSELQTKANMNSRLEVAA